MNVNNLDSTIQICYEKYEDGELYSIRGGNKA
jgi:hypothetical protein